MTPERDELREAVADQCHRHWARTIRHILSNGTATGDGGITLPAEYVRSLSEQAGWRYRDMTEPEREYDRREADRYLAIVRGVVLT